MISCQAVKRECEPGEQHQFSQQITCTPPPTLMESRALPMSGKCSTTELCLQPFKFTCLQVREAIKDPGPLRPLLLLCFSCGFRARSVTGLNVARHWTFLGASVLIPHLCTPLTVSITLFCVYPQLMRPSDQTHRRRRCKAHFKIHIEIYFHVSKGLSRHLVLSWHLGIWRAELITQRFLRPYRITAGNWLVRRHFLQSVVVCNHSSNVLSPQSSEGLFPSRGGRCSLSLSLCSQLV